MTRSHYETDFYVSDGDVKTLCHVSVAEPELSAEGDAVCKVKLTPLLRTEKQIFGISADQAKELAVKFVKQLLVGKSLTDLDGNRIEVTDDNDLVIFKRHNSDL